MKTLLTALALFAFITPALAADLTCEDKIKSIENEISYAKEHNNKNRLNGLEKALEKTKANCTDENLAEKRADEIADKQKDIDEAQEELDEAISKGKSADKIMKKQKKLEEKTRELQEETEL